MSSPIAIPTSAGVGVDRDDTDLARTTMRRVSLRLLPFLFVLYVCNFLDRTNVAIARYGFGFEGFPAEQIGPGDFFVDSPQGILCL